MTPLYVILASLALIGLTVLIASLKKSKGGWDKLGRMIVLVFVSTPLLLICLVSSIVGMMQRDALFLVYLLICLALLVPVGFCCLLVYRAFSKH